MNANFDPDKPVMVQYGVYDWIERSNHTAYLQLEKLIDEGYPLSNNPLTVNRIMSEAIRRGYNPLVKTLQSWLNIVWTKVQTCKDTNTVIFT